MAGLDLTMRDLGLRTNGRAKQKITAVRMDELTQADLATIHEERGTKAPQLQKLRERHHALARALASGMPQGDAGILCGYTGSRVSILLTDHSFQELVEFYSDKVEEFFYDTHEKMAGLGVDAIQELAERLEDAPEDFSTSMLLELATKMADRTGHGVTTKSEVSVKHGLADRMAEARKRTDQYLTEQPQVIDVTPEPASGT